VRPRSASLTYVDVVQSSACGLRPQCGHVWELLFGAHPWSRSCACRLSELRTLELLDGLCKQLDAYEYQQPTESDPDGSWLRFNKPNKTTEERTQAHQLTQQV
jgi:hypothetical protein